MKACALLLLCCLSLPCGCVHTVVHVEEQRRRPIEENTPTDAPRVWSVVVAPTDRGAHLTLWTHATCTKRLVVAVKRVRVTQRSGNTLVTPEPDVREVVGESVGPCQRHVAPQTKLVVEGPPGTVAVTVHTDGDGASTVPFDAGAVRRVTTGSGVDVEKQLDAPR